MIPFTVKELRIASLLSRGLSAAEIAAEIGTTKQTVKNRLRAIYAKLHMVAPNARVKFAIYWNCELFQIGLREVGLLGGDPRWWRCELFQLGLQEAGLAIPENTFHHACA